MADVSLNASNTGVVKKAVVLLSGGLDSSTVLAIAQAEGYQIHAISFRYGQRHQVELACAQRVAQAAGVPAPIVIDIDLSKFGGSALTAPLDVPKHDSVDQIGTDIPITYVPARNTVFLSLALAYAESIGARDIFLGVNALDYSGYPDCRPEFIECFEKLANLATKAGVGGNAFRIHTPLIHLTKAQIVARGLQLGVDYSLTSSCYDPLPEGTACGHCDACLLRKRGFDQNNASDPIAYAP